MASRQIESPFPRGTGPSPWRGSSDWQFEDWPDRIGTAQHARRPRDSADRLWPWLWQSGHSPGCQAAWPVLQVACVHAGPDVMVCRRGWGGALGAVVTPSSMLLLVDGCFAPPPPTQLSPAPSGLAMDAEDTRTLSWPQRWGSCSVRACVRAATCTLGHQFETIMVPSCPVVGSICPPWCSSKPSGPASTWSTTGL